MSRPPLGNYQKLTSNLINHPMGKAIRKAVQGVPIENRRIKQKKPTVRKETVLQSTPNISNLEEILSPKTAQLAVKNLQLVPTSLNSTIINVNTPSNSKSNGPTPRNKKRNSSKAQLRIKDSRHDHQRRSAPTTSQPSPKIIEKDPSLMQLALKLSKIYSAEETQEILSSKHGGSINMVRIPEPRRKRPFSAKAGYVRSQRRGLNNENSLFNNSIIKNNMTNHEARISKSHRKEDDQSNSKSYSPARYLSSQQINKDVLNRSRQRSKISNNDIELLKESCELSTRLSRLQGLNKLRDSIIKNDPNKIRKRERTVTFVKT